MAGRDEKARIIFLFLFKPEFTSNMETIVNNLQEALQNASEQFRDSDKLKALELANEEFKEMVKSGIAKERGYNLESSDMAHRRTVSLNTSDKH